MITPIIISLLCGITFTLGMILVIAFYPVKSKNSINKELLEYWRSSSERHDKQLAILERICKSIEKEH